MSNTDLVALLPLIVVAVMGAVVMLAGAYGARRVMLHWLTRNRNRLGVDRQRASPCPT